MPFPTPGPGPRRSGALAAASARAWASPRRGPDGYGLSGAVPVAHRRRERRATTTVRVPRTHPGVAPSRPVPDCPRRHDPLLCPSGCPPRGLRSSALRWPVPPVARGTSGGLRFRRRAQKPAEAPREACGSLPSPPRGLSTSHTALRPTTRPPGGAVASPPTGRGRRVRAMWAVRLGWSPDGLRLVRTPRVAGAYGAPPHTRVIGGDVRALSSHDRGFHSWTWCVCGRGSSCVAGSSMLLG